MRYMSELESLEDMRIRLKDEKRKKKSEQEFWLNQVCTCGHVRKDHNGIDGYCYNHKCQCEKFEGKKL